MRDLARLLADSSCAWELTAAEAAAAMETLVALQTILASRLRSEPTRPSAATPEADDDKLLTPDAVARLLGVSRRYVYSHADEWPFARRLSRKALRFHEAGLRKFIAKKSP